MVLLTMIGRVSDGLVLTSSVQSNLTIGGTQSDSRVLGQYQNEAKQILRRIGGNVPIRACIESKDCRFYYQIEQSIYVGQQFLSEYQNSIQLAQRPYAFIEFDNYIQRAQKRSNEQAKEISAAGGGGSRIGMLNNELHEVQRIMVTNIEEVLGRGEALNALNSKATVLSTMSHRYKSDAKDLNRAQTFAKVVAIVIFIVALLFFLKYFLF
ncbi:hypothetical protein ACOME3_007261 [Neoechinorhynchus agilis]